MRKGVVMAKYKQSYNEDYQLKKGKYLLDYGDKAYKRQHDLRLKRLQYTDKTLDREIDLLKNSTQLGSSTLEFVDRKSERMHQRDMQRNKINADKALLYEKNQHSERLFDKKTSFDKYKIREISHKDREAIAAGILTYKNGKLQQGPNAHIPHRWDPYQETYVPVHDPYRRNQKSELEYQRKENKRVRNKQTWAKDIARHPYKDILAYIFDPDVKEHKRKNKRKKR